MTDTIVERPDSPFPLGRLIEHDPQSRLYPFRAAGPTAPLLSVRHTCHIGILNQSAYYQADGTGPLSLGSCVGNSIISALACDPFWQTIADLAIVRDGFGQRDAVEIIYGPATGMDPWPGSYPPDDTGTSGLAGAKAAKQAGLISGYRHGFSLDDDLAALQTRPVITGVDWMSSFDSPDGDGLIRISPTARSRGGHEVCVDEYDATRGWVGFPNSWGEAWGVGGRGYMEVETWDRLLQARGDVTVLEPLTMPAPRPETPDPGAAPFPFLPGASAAVAERVVRTATRAGLTPEAWLERRLRTYFGMPR